MKSFALLACCTPLSICVVAIGVCSLQQSVQWTTSWVHTKQLLLNETTFSFFEEVYTRHRMYCTSYLYLDLYLDQDLDLDLSIGDCHGNRNRRRLNIHCNIIIVH